MVAIKEEFKPLLNVFPKDYRIFEPKALEELIRPIPKFMKTAQPPITTTEWIDWLEGEEERLRKVYLISPGHLIAEYRREREITRGYHGREILELLQNAGDAARNAGEQGRVRIVVTEEGLVMGNTGCPFDKGGVESLLTANLSPKRQRETVVIGDKGLGFRSILNWTDSPIVYSGNLGLAFLPNYAAEILRGLESESEDLANRVAGEREFAGDLIVPRLAFPQWIPDWAGHPWPRDAGLRTVAMTCRQLRIEGFATAVGMSFAEKRAYEEAVRQVDELSPEFLLLVDSLGCLEIEVKGRVSKVWTCKRSDQQRTILGGEQVLSRWTVSTVEDREVPGNLLDHEEKTKNRFKLTLAVPNSGPASPQRLFCYFPTDVELPLPLLAHATVELDETRKHVNDTRANRHILACLAEQIAELAEQQAGQSDQNEWAGCRLVTPSAAWSGELQKFGFADALKKAARRKKLVPVLGGGYRIAEEARQAPGDEAKWWPRRHFPEIAAIQRKEERGFAEALGVQPLSAEQVVQRLLEVDDLTVEERACAVAGLLQTSNQLASDKLAPLLCDETGNPLPEGVSAMLQPAGDLPPVPCWATIRFLHPELRQHLGRLLKTTDSRELQQKLKPLGVVEYSLSALIRPILAEGSRRVRDYGEEESSIRGEVLEFLWRVYQNTAGATPFPSEASLKLPTQAGGWEATGSVYLGEGFGLEGNVTQDLYGGWAKRKLLESPGKLGLEAEGADLTQFLLWLGVARWPREEPTSVDSDFITTVKNGLHYPVYFGDWKFDTREELAGAWFTDAKTVDGLGKILEHAPSEAILAWMALDSRMAAWSRSAHDHGTLKIHPYRAKYDRSYSGAVPSYTHWQVSNFPWLPTANGEKSAPRHCLLGDGQFEALFPQPRQPDVILGQRYGVSERIADCYIRAGVMPGLGRLGHDELYRLLLEVPSLSADGKASRALCRWFLSNESELLGFAAEYQKRFFTEGEVWGSKEDHAGYFKISELRHVDFDGMSPALLKKLAIADLPKRVGAEKVKRILGITALDRAAIKQELISCRTSPSQVDRAQWFDEAKPSIRRLRQAQTKQMQAMGTVERLELILCDELQIHMEYEGTTYDHAVSEGEWFIFSDKLYVRGDLEDSIDLLADAAGMAIASVFGIAEGDAFAKILRCEPKNRGKLLKRMCGDDFHEEIEAAKAKPGPNYVGPINPLTASDSGEKKTPEIPLGEQPSPDVEAHQDVVNPKLPGVRQVPHVAQPPVANRELVVRNVQRKAGKANSPRQMVNGDKCERMALAFEEQNDPPRFAIGVGHLTGVDAPGFDLASFASAEDRAVFRNPETRDWSKVLRCIEVKGRSSSTAKIELKGNELKAARQYGNRYYLYRFYEEDDGQYMVSILENPLIAEEAKAQIVEIDLERAKQTQRFEFVVDMAVDDQ